MLVKMEKFKTLVFKKQSKYKCRYVAIWDLEIFESHIPTLLPMTATIKSLKEFHPKLDLEEIEMVVVTLVDPEAIDYSDDCGHPEEDKDNGVCRACEDEDTMIKMGR